MNQIVRIKRSFTSGNVPPSLDEGELAINVVDRRFWIGTASGIVELFAVADFVKKTGDTMSGALIINRAWGSSVELGDDNFGGIVITATNSHLTLRKSAANSSAHLRGTTNTGTLEWVMTLGNGSVNNFLITVGGAPGVSGPTELIAPFMIYRSTGSSVHGGINFGNSNAAGHDVNLFLTKSTSAALSYWKNTKLISRQMDGTTAGTIAQPRWTLNLADDTPEPRDGSNGGSNLYIARHANDGTEIDRPIAIDRATGQVLINGSPVRTDFLPLAGGTLNAVTGVAGGGSGLTINNTSANEIAMRINNNSTGWGVGLQVTNTNTVAGSSGGLAVSNQGYCGLGVRNRAGGTIGTLIYNDPGAGTALNVQNYSNNPGLWIINGETNNGAPFTYTKEISGVSHTRARLDSDGNLAIGLPTGPAVSTNGHINVSDGYYINGVKISTGAHVGADAPVNPKQGDLWFDDEDGQLFIFDAADQWVIAINQTGLPKPLPTAGDLESTPFTNTFTNADVTSSGSTQAYPDYADVILCSRTLPAGDYDFFVRGRVRVTLLDATTSGSPAFNLMGMASAQAFFAIGPGASEIISQSSTNIAVGNTSIPAPENQSQIFSFGPGRAKRTHPFQVTFGYNTRPIATFVSAHGGAVPPFSLMYRLEFIGEAWFRRYLD